MTELNGIVLFSGSEKYSEELPSIMQKVMEKKLDERGFDHGQPQGFRCVPKADAEGRMTQVVVGTKLASVTMSAQDVVGFFVGDGRMTIITGWGKLEFLLEEEGK